jgi:sugar (pentulose or hexulose) kinase
MAKSATPYRSIINPDDKLFATPGNMPKRIAEYCAKTGQPVPEKEGEFVRCILDSLSLRYRATVENIEELTGEKTTAVNIVGGGTQDKLLCQLTADACGTEVVAGPVEATAIGNICVQAIAAGEIANVKEARQVVAESFDVEYYTPNTSVKNAVDEAYGKFCELTK